MAHHANRSSYSLERFYQLGEAIWRACRLPSRCRLVIRAIVSGCIVSKIIYSQRYRFKYPRIQHSLFVIRGRIVIADKNRTYHMTNRTCSFFLLIYAHYFCRDNDPIQLHRKQTIESQIPTEYLPSLAPEEYVPKLVCSLSIRGTGVEETGKEELFFAIIPA